MNKILTISLLSIVFLGSSNLHIEAASFDISGYDGIEWNALGLAVNPENGNIFVTSLSYQGEDNLWEFTSNGVLINSTRVVGTENDGELQSAVVGKDGHLFINSVIQGERKTIEVSQDGETLFSSFNNEYYTSGGGSLSYNETSETLFIGSYRDKAIYETTIDGNLLRRIDIDLINNPYDIVYDYFTESIYTIGIFDPFFEYPFEGLGKNILHEYQKDSSGRYFLADAYNLESIGTTPGQSQGLAIDLNRSTGLFYLQNNNRSILEFSKDDLISCPITPWDEIVTTAQLLTTDYLTLGDTISFEYWFETDAEDGSYTEQAFDVLYLQEAETQGNWKSFGQVSSYYSSSGWVLAEFVVPEELRGETVKLRFSLSDLGPVTNPVVYLRNIDSEQIESPISIEEILLFFDESVAAGTIYGSGKKPHIANLKLWLFSKTLEAAKYFIKKDKIKYACKALNRAFLRCDSDPWPIDFVKGEAVEELEDMILKLMDELGCE